MPTLPRGRPSTPLRDAYPNSAIQSAQRIYYQHDANFNTTAIVGLVGGTWQVTQRYIYDPYGNVTVLNADWTNASSQIPLTQYLHQGGRLDPITGLYDFRHRDYSPTLGNWIEQDPMGYVNGASRYQFVVSNPATRLDPTGKFWGWIAGGAAIGAFIGIQFIPGVDVVVDAGGLLAAIGTSGGAAIVGTATAGGAVGGVIAGKVAHYAAGSSGAGVFHSDSSTPEADAGAISRGISAAAKKAVNSGSDALRDALTPQERADAAAKYRAVGELNRESNVVRGFNNARADWLEGKGPWPGDKAKEWGESNCPK